VTENKSKQTNLSEFTTISTGKNETTELQKRENLGNRRKPEASEN